MILRPDDGSICDLADVLDASERERLRAEIDRRKRERIGGRNTDRDAAWVTIPEASSLLGVRATILRPRVRKLGIEVRVRSGRMFIPVSALDYLREQSR